MTYLVLILSLQYEAIWLLSEWTGYYFTTFRSVSVLYIFLSFFYISCALLPYKCPTIKQSGLVSLTGKPIFCSIYVNKL